MVIDWLPGASEPGRYLSPTFRSPSNEFCWAHVAFQVVIDEPASPTIPVTPLPANELVDPSGAPTG